MPFEKVTFTRIDGSTPQVEAQFNPAELTLSKGVQLAEVAIPGLDMPIIQFVRGQTETLALELFFDTTEDGSPVTVLTDSFYQLIKIDGQTHAPPVCELAWGAQDFPGSKLSGPWAKQARERFTCVVESVRQRFTLFSEGGVPLRATLTVNLREYKTLDQQIAKIGFQSADHTKAHIVQEGETLTRIAHTAYGNPSQWRMIAEQNRIDDPLALSPGTVLQIPPRE